MSSIDFLQTYTEIAVAIIGFSGVVVALRGKQVNEEQRITLSMLILFGTFALAMGILPQILIEAGVSEICLWKGLSALFVVLQVAGGIARNLQAKSRGTVLSKLGGIGFVPIMLAAIGVAAFNIYFGLFWLYMFNLFLYLLASIAIFRNLVGLGGDA